MNKDFSVLDSSLDPFWLKFTELSLAERNCYDMKNNNAIRFVSSLILLPVMSSPTAVNLVNKSGTDNDTSSKIVLNQKFNIEAYGLFSLNQEDDTQAKEEALIKAQGEAIDAFFAKREAPLLGTGYKMAQEARKHDIDWRLLPAIATRESNAGKQACKRVKFSFFGFGSCKIGFKSNDDAIEKVAEHLGGNNPNTEKYYKDKTTEEILKKYNPDSIVPGYSKQVLKIMDMIGEEDLSLPENSKVDA